MGHISFTPQERLLPKGGEWRLRLERSWWLGWELGCFPRSRRSRWTRSRRACPSTLIPSTQTCSLWQPAWSDERGSAGSSRVGSPLCWPRRPSMLSPLRRGEWRNRSSTRGDGPTRTVSLCLPRGCLLPAFCPGLPSLSSGLRWSSSSRTSRSKSTRQRPNSPVSSTASAPSSHRLVSRDSTALSLLSSSFTLWLVGFTTGRTTFSDLTSTMIPVLLLPAGRSWPDRWLAWLLGSCFPSTPSRPASWSATLPPPPSGPPPNTCMVLAASVPLPLDG